MNTASKILLFALTVLAAIMPMLSACGNFSAGGSCTQADTNTKVAAMPEEQKMTTQETAAPANFEPTAIENIVYKKIGDIELGLDFYGPTVPTDGPAPVFFYIHGGAWVGGNRSIKDAGMVTVIMDQIRAFGVAVVPVSYRLTTETVTFPAHINDVCDAIRFIVKHADDYNIDPQRIGMIGFSAGGHLSLLAGFCTTEFGDAPELANVDFDVKCVIDFCGPTDLTQLVDVPLEDDRVYLLGILKDFLGAQLQGNEEHYIYASPIGHVGKNPDLSLLILQGRSDEIVPHAQADKLYEKCVEAGYDVKYIPVENANHGFAPADTSMPTNPTMPEIISECLAFIKDKLI